MQSSKLLEVIKKLNDSERERLSHFLNSPYFFKGKPEPNTIRLYHYIQQCAPEFADDKLIKVYVYPHIFPNEDPIKGKLEKVMTNLYQQIERFIVYETSGLDHDKMQKALLQAKFFRLKELDKYFHKSIDLIKKMQKKILRRDKAFYYNQFLIEREISEYESFYNKRKEDLNLPSTLKSLDIYYIITKQEYTSWLLAQNNYYMPAERQDKLEILDKISDTLKKENYLGVPIIEIYDQVLQLLKNDHDDAPYPKLKALIQSREALIPFEQLKALHALCRNYSIRQNNKGNKKYLAEAFSLYKEHLEQGYLYYENGLLPSTIKNMVDLGLKFGQFDWVLQFLQFAKNKIVGTKNADEVFNFNLANYYFAIKDYDKAIEFLEASYEDSYYKIAARRMEIKIYFETQSVLLDSKLEAFKVYLFRISKSQLPEIQKVANNNFVDMVRQMNTTKTANNEERVNKLIKKAESKKMIAEQNWLIEKLQEMF